MDEDKGKFGKKIKKGLMIAGGVVGLVALGYGAAKLGCISAMKSGYIQIRLPEGWEIVKTAVEEVVSEIPV
jgi:hypothetical protein